MTAIFNIIAPVFLMIVVGYAAMRRSLLMAGQLEGIGKFVLRIGMPMLVFNALATKPFAQTFKPEYFFAYSGASVLSFVAGWQNSRLRGLHPTLAALNGLGFGMSNSGFVGYPLLLMALGSSAGGYYAMNVMTENLLICLPLFILLDLSQGQHRSWGQVLRQAGKTLLTNPIIQAMPVGLVFSFGLLPLPVFAERISGMLASSSMTLALFMIGASLCGISLRDCKPADMLLVAAGKLMLFPLLMFVLMNALGADKETLFAGMLFAAAPIPSLYPLFGSMHGFAKETSGTMLLVTLLSLIPISLVLYVWQPV
ncbi:transporter [Neisseria chenwenguii]|uniref:Transporter n=1 Tax=Neisseria chenwenguii TaxID=1853278 RepID=A0A220S4B3_9NEIS|nr:AEC family transporter [Neisseria chenwenguii]ASK28045.1 transporter [Neisseria chenwenguii]